jgi:hypothetical protein
MNLGRRRHAGALPSCTLTTDAVPT